MRLNSSKQPQAPVDECINKMLQVFIIQTNKQKKALYKT